MTRFGDAIQRAHGVPVQVRRALCWGRGGPEHDSRLHLDCTAVGQATHLAARMAQMAKLGSVLLTAETLQLAQGPIQVEPDRAHRGQGRRGMVKFPGATRLGNAAGRGLVVLAPSVLCSPHTVG